MFAFGNPDKNGIDTRERNDHASQSYECRLKHGAVADAEEDVFVAEQAWREETIPRLEVTAQRFEHAVEEQKQQEGHT